MKHAVVLNPVSKDALRERIERAIPGASVEVGTFSGDDHFEVRVVAAQFEGKSLIERHRMVYDAVGELLGGPVHALSLKTHTPKQAEELR